MPFLAPGLWSSAAALAKTLSVTDGEITERVRGKFQDSDKTSCFLIDPQNALKKKHSVVNKCSCICGNTHAGMILVSHLIGRAWMKRLSLAFHEKHFLSITSLETQASASEYKHISEGERQDVGC